MESDSGPRHSLLPPTPQDLPSFVPYACKNLGASFNVRIDIQIQEDYVSKVNTPRKSAKSKLSSRHQPLVQESSTLEETPTPLSVTLEDDEIAVIVVKDLCDRLVEIHIEHEPKLPCLLAKVIGLCLPFQQHFNKLLVRWSSLDDITLYEISKYLESSRITELCLDGSPVVNRNYAVLLEQPSHLIHLSLARCDIDDVNCISICSKLNYPTHASRTLHILNLSSNAIGDDGVRAVGEMLRSNRMLRYLNLADNLITDVGAEHVFRSLTEFVMTEDEIVDKGIRIMRHLKQKKEVHERCLREVMREQERSRIQRRASTRPLKKSATEARLSNFDVYAARAEAMTKELLGDCVDPFDAEETTCHDQRLHSIGNWSLCGLNLCYNNLGYASIVNLLQVLIYQSSISEASKFGKGLVRGLIEGNPLPVVCEEYDRLQEILSNLMHSKESALRTAKHTRSRSRQ